MVERGCLACGTGRVRVYGPCGVGIGNHPAVGMTAGAFASVKFALNIDQNVIKWALFVMVCLTSASVLLFT